MNILVRPYVGMSVLDAGKAEVNSAHTLLEVDVNPHKVNVDELLSQLIAVLKSKRSFRKESVADIAPGGGFTPRGAQSPVALSEPEETSVADRIFDNLMQFGSVHEKVRKGETVSFRVIGEKIHPPKIL